MSLAEKGATGIIQAVDMPDAVINHIARWRKAGRLRIEIGSDGAGIRRALAEAEAGLGPSRDDERLDLQDDDERCVARAGRYLGSGIWLLPPFQSHEAHLACSVTVPLSTLSRGQALNSVGSATAALTGA